MFRFRLIATKYSIINTHYSIRVGDLVQASVTPRNPINSLSRLRASIMLSRLLFLTKTLTLQDSIALPLS